MSWWNQATQQAGNAPVRLTGKRNKDLKRYGRSLEETRTKRGGGIGTVEQMLMNALGSPTIAAESYLPFYQRAAEGAAAPALRDFEKTVSGVQGNIASRFGGNVSTEETRGVRNVSDDFSRNLTEALARVGPQAVTAGQRHTQQLAGTRGMLGQEELDFYSLLQNAIMGQKDEGSIWGKMLGKGLGLAGSFINPLAA